MDKEFTLKDSYIAKGAAVLFLLNSHLFRDAGAVAEFKIDYRPLSLDFFRLISEFGSICVAVFVFLTAYGITKGLIKQGEITAGEMYCQAAVRMRKLMFRFFTVFVSVVLLWGHWFDFTSLYGEGKQGMLYMLADSVGISQILDTPTLNMTWWYMWIAYVLIFLVPLLYLLVQKTGYSLLILAFLCPVVIELNPTISRYLFTASVGVCAAYGGWLDRMINIKNRQGLCWAAAGIVLILCVIVRQNYFVQEHILHLADGGIALFFIWFCTFILGNIPIVREILGLIGRHSMNIYMIHTFFYLILWRQYIYAFHYAGVILAVLLSVCLIYSIALEWAGKSIKKFLIKCAFICNAWK